MAKRVTAKVVCGWKQTGDTGVMVQFLPDYAQGRNSEWATATPSLNLTMTVKDANLFQTGQAYTLTFEPEES